MERHKQVTDALDPLEVVTASLEHARLDWLPHHKRAVRAGGNSAEANRDASDALRPIDRLLDEFNRIKLAQTVEVVNG